MGSALLRTVVERTITEEHPEKMFYEEIKIGGCTFQVLIVLDLDLNDNSIRIQYLRDLRRIVNIEVRKDGVRIDLTDDEFITFFNLTVVCILEAQKKKKSFQLLEDDEIEREIASNDVFGTKKIVVHDLCLTSVDALTSDKFGCKF